MKSIKLFLLVFFLSVQFIYSQGSNKSYIKKDNSTQVITVYDISYHGDDIMTLNVFSGEIDKIQWGTSHTIVSYRYLGIDNQNNLHIQRSQKDYSLKSEDVCELIFKLDLNKPTEIILIGQRSQLIPLLVKIQIEANNNFIKSKYLGNLPIYNE